MRSVGVIAGLVLFVTSFNGLASHLRSVEIIAKRVDCNSLLYEITIVAYVSTNSLVAFGGDGDMLTFGDGLNVPIPEQSPQIIDPFLKVGKVEYKTFHTYASPGNYVLTYTEGNRNDGILNIESSATTALSTETFIVIEPGTCNSAPALLIPPIDRACIGVAFYHSLGAIDPEDDSLSYQLVTPLRAPGLTVSGYALPNDAKFYGGNFNQGNETENGPPTISIDPIDGTLTWDAPGRVGEFAIAIMVSEWRLNTGDSTWQKIGHTIRDMQIIVEDCLNQKPDLTAAESICVVAGTTIQFKALGSDPDHDNVVIEAFSDVFSLDENSASIAPSNPIEQSTLPPNDTASVTFIWNTTCAHIKAQPYKLILKITDRPISGPRLVRFKTVQLRVLAPLPEYESVSINPISKQVVLKLNDYPCENIDGFQIWRRVAKYDYEQPECESGMPHFLRYKLLEKLPANVFSFTDANIAIGAQYCYRIVALVGNNNLQSKISLDTCIIPKPAEAPVITNVSVLKTNSSTGEVLVRWTSPFDIDAMQYPPPYTYKVYRAEGLAENVVYQLITSSPIGDTVFVDVGLNTTDIPFQYKIELYVPSLTTLPVDTSSSASSIHLAIEPQPNSITLTWEGITPWSNYSQNFPYHLIYRSEDADGEFTLIDSVDVNEYGNQYIDNGQFQNEALIDQRHYFYKILTRGTYGNFKIIEPLENFCQIAKGNLLDTIPPCSPTVSLEEVNCQSLPCSGKEYYNVLSWTNEEDVCSNDIVAYAVYVNNGSEPDFKLLTTLVGNTFTHGNLSTRAQCYQIKAIDFAGNESDFSEPVCGDNCAYFELPNVFTPASRDELNDYFMPYTRSSNDTTKCARFVITVDVNIYDRWGTEVYSKKSITPEGDFILWNGLTNTGNEVDPGIYYYSTKVQFDMREPEQQHKQFKGWVHLIH